MQVLLIEDNPDHAELILDCFYDAFQEVSKVTHVTTISEGLELLEEEGAFDCCLCDLQLPDSSIEETKERLKALNIATPIIVLTSLNDLDVAKPFVKIGVQDYLPKDELNADMLERTLLYGLERKAFQKKLEEKNRDMAAFCRSLSHDFQDDIRRISTAASMLKRMMIQSETFDHQHERCTDILEFSANSVSQLVRSLYQFLSTDMENFHLRKLNLEEVVADVAQKLEGNGKKTFQLEYGRIGVVCGESSQLFIMFQNLISNSVKYCERDPVITISSSEVDNQWLEVKFEDNGIGMEESALSKIFEPFKRLKTKKRYEGTGLGLSIVKRIMEKHNGSVSVESELGKGSIFTLKFPLADND